MISTTPFHDQLSQLNRTGLYGHWSGYLSAVRYDNSAKHEYFAVRNAAGVFDTSPLYKYWIRGRDAERFLSGVMTRDVRRCRPGRASTRSGATTAASCSRTECCSGTQRPSSCSPRPNRTSDTSVI
jgi:glycine cleavage system aminomethyltransferase T